MKDIENKIKAQIDKIEVSLPTLKEAAKPVDLDTSIGRLSRMDAIAAQGIQLRSYQSALAKLGHLQRALERLKEDSFGVCAECEEDIAIERILAVPESQLCIHCAKRRD